MNPALYFFSLIFWLQKAYNSTALKGFPSQKGKIVEGN